MIKTLRRRFIIISAISVFAALLLIISSINFLNYRDVESECDRVIQVLQRNNGRFPGREEGQGTVPENRPPMDDRSDRRPEMEYDSRYFIVNLGTDGSIDSIDLEFIASTDMSTAEELAHTAISGRREKGFLDNFRYGRSDRKIIFLEASRELEQFRGFCLTSILISAIAFVVAFVIIFILSGRILAPVAESYEKQKRFITDAGHELKTPLAIIKADIDVIEMDGKGNEWTQDIARQADRMSSLTNDLIHLSRMEEGVKLQKIEFPISDVAQETADSFRSTASICNKPLKISVERNISYEGDEKAIRELFNILLDNAVKYGREGEEIEFSLERSGRNVIIECRNSTEGLDEEQAGHLFERFYRADKSRNSSGFGIGLSVAKAIVDNHRGKINARLQGNEIVFRIVL